MTDLSVTSTVVMTIWHIGGSIIKNQASGGKWLISEAIVDTDRIYIYFSGDDVDEVLKVELDHMVEEQYGSGEAIHLRRNLEETHTKIRGNVRTKLAKYLEPILELTPADKYQWWFELTLDPRYVNELAYVRKLDEVETFDTRTIINEINPNFYDSIVVAELAENP